ncbi:hypothetical protein DFH07DRAFT_942925 [Mycena maculata]|uniref:Fungal-type protein kinase domain-containing protein n=1 Tax=Mycena maculata TaxID=230809 RepID=A0AAD7IK37_9AGAR|nr:hypothetical protein DFH07DRAFT_942925 [Mycena maculata]
MVESRGVDIGKVRGWAVFPRGAWKQGRHGEEHGSGASGERGSVHTVVQAVQDLVLRRVCVKYKPRYGGPQSPAAAATATDLAMVDGGVAVVLGHDRPAQVEAATILAVAGCTDAAGGDERYAALCGPDVEWDVSVVDVAAVAKERQPDREGPEGLRGPLRNCEGARWGEKGSPSESSILQDIYDKVKALDRPDLMTTFGVHFMRPIANAIIGKTVQGVSCYRDYKHLPLLETGSSEGTPLPTTSGSRTFVTGNTIVLPPDIPPPRRFVDRDQYRLIFPGVLVPLHQIRDVNLQIQVLRDLPLALELLHSVGFVHHDLSNTNAMYDPVAKRGVVTDLEYAVAYGQPNEGDVKTGTPFFWSIEVEHNSSYLFLQDPQLEHLLAPRTPIAAVPNPSLEENEENEIFHPRFIFFHSVLHDLESGCHPLPWRQRPSIRRPFFFFLKPQRDGTGDGTAVAAVLTGRVGI